MVDFLLFALLAGQSAAATPATAAPTSAASAKVKCKREVETGSLAKVKKVCHTVAEWDAMRREARETTTGLQTTTPGQTN